MSRNAVIQGKLNVLSVIEFPEKSSKQHCDLLNLSERDETLESYYVNLVGGEKDA